MAKHGKKYRAAAEKVENRSYPLGDAIELIQEIAYADFDETLDVALRLGVDPRHADQMVRGTVVLPHGTGKEMRVVAFAQGEKVREAEEAGADFVGGEELAEKIEGGWMEFDAVVATPDMMRVVGRLGRILGPRGLMPNPKAGTVTMDVGQAVEEIKAGKVEFRVEKTGIVQAPVGKLSFTAEQLADNVRGFVDAIVRARPAAAKGRYVRSAYVSSSMGPGVALDESAINAKLEV
ncbi:MAG: 50S ribosomal protein L1 [Thermoanaerobaculia bacterium]|nr:50S ribosomal protein L1 [Thermoanaerobaculia bacterium]